MKLYRSRRGIVTEDAGRFYDLNAPSWDDLVIREDLHGYLRHVIGEAKPADSAPQDLLPPIGSQEV